MTRTVALKSGDRIDRFRIVRLLGVGGMGEVYLALDTRDFRNVALKTLSESHEDFETLLQFFSAEVELYRRISHPNVVNFIAQGRGDGLCWVALEHIDGRPLSERLDEEGPLDVDKGLAWLQELAFALHAAHQQKVLHRDIKPDNVMIDASGGIKLIDFGLARRGAGEDAGKGERIGTLAYMAPECFQGHGADERSDLYSLGLVAYEMLTGQRMIEDVGLASSILEAHEEADELPPFITNRQSDRVEALEELIRSMLRRHPEDRIPSTASLLGRLGEVVESRNGAPAATDEGRARMAQAELADTHFWQAKNLLAEDRVLEAIDEFLQVSTFVTILGERVRSNLQGELDLLLVNLHPRERESEESPFALSQPLYVEKLLHLIELYGRLAPPELTRLRLRLVLRRLRAVLTETELHRSAEWLLSKFPASIPVTRVFLEGMTRRFPEVARGISLTFLRDLLRRRRLVEAEEELDRHADRFGKEREWIAVKKELFLCQAETQDEEADALEAYSESRATKSSLHSEDICLRYLARHAPSAHVLQALASIRRRERRHTALVETLGALGELRFWQGRTGAAREAFVEALGHDGRNRKALSFLLEIVDEGDGFSPPPRTERELVLAIHGALDLYELQRDELNRHRTGTASDESLLLELEDLAARKDRREDLWRWRFERCELLMKSDRLDEAREVLETALVEAPNRQKALEKLKTLPHLHRLYGGPSPLHLQVEEEAPEETDWLAKLRERASTEGGGDR